MTYGHLYTAWNKDFRNMTVLDPRYATGDAVYHMIENARENAQYTIDVERAAPANEFDRLMIGGIEETLACQPTSTEVVQWFAAHGITG